jgi:hypothetical protein
MGTVFNTELKTGDFIVSVVGGVTYTLPVKTVDSAIQATLIKAYDGPTQTGAAWYAVPREAMNLITAQLAAETAKAMRGMNYDKENWQQVFSGSGSITVKLPDGSAFTGPAWGYIANALSTKSSTISLGNGSDGRPWWAAFTSRYDIGIALHGANAPSVSPWDAPSSYSLVNYLPSLTDNTGTAIASNWGGAHDYFMNSRNSASSGYQGWKGWVALWHSKNTTLDSNGFIKKASPIARLSGASEKMADDYLAGFTLAGSVAVNSEAEGVTAERVSVGVYNVIGSLGFAEEGWNIEVPQDVNGNRLCFVEASTAKDGTITVKVSKRRFDIDTAAIVAGDPMDIPDGRWIDLRLEMPVEEEIEAQASFNE